jgi:prevent-host-death family protein
MNDSYCISNRTLRIVELNTLLMPKANNSEVFIISAFRARANFGKLLSRVENDRHSLIIEKRGTPRAVLLGLQDYVRLAAPEPEVLRFNRRGIRGQRRQRSDISRNREGSLRLPGTSALKNLSAYDCSSPGHRYQYSCFWRSQAPGFATNRPRHCYGEAGPPLLFVENSRRIRRGLVASGNPNSHCSA